MSSNDSKWKCPHCDRKLAYRTYQKHKRLYYRPAQRSWIKIQRLQSSVSSQVPVEQINDELTSGPALPESPTNSEFDSQNELLHMFGDEQEIIPSEEDSEQFSDDSNSDEGEELWEESDESCTEECPELPNNVNQTSTVESGILSWLLIFLLRMQAKYYIPDAALQCLIRFLCVLFCVLGRYSSVIANIAARFPRSLYYLRKRYSSGQEFKKFVVCRKCNSIYSHQECIEYNGSLPVTRNCFYRRYPNRTITCGTPLLKTVELSSGRKVLRPYKTYCYYGLKKSLQKLLQLPEFVTLCEEWRSNVNTEENTMRDIYDGRIWKEFMHYNGEPFLDKPYTFFLAMNVDWFKPHKLTESKVGAIYLTVMNLPYYARFKREYLLLASLIPGPNEPKGDINSFLQPLVSELLDFWDGVPMSVHGRDGLQEVKCALLCVASDLPAARKVCGFLGHSARLGCSRCKKEFPGGFGESKDYSGFERDKWPPRSNHDHRTMVDLILKEKAITRRNLLESQYGCRYSALLDLPYFDPVRMTVIDPMHNLFLGSAKHVLKDIWIKSGLIREKQIQQIQDVMNSMKTPTGVGRIPRKIETGFSGFTADQFKNWVTLYSIPCLKEILPGNDFECWRHFVLACRILCQHALTTDDILLADALLLHFSKRVQHMYGENAITPNMHMHCHFKDVLLDYGPVYSFWCFSYERYNGILETQPTNNKEVEIQLMQRFISDNNSFAFSHPNIFKNEFAPVTIHATLSRLTGSALQTIQPSLDQDSLELPKSYKRIILDEDDKTVIAKLLENLSQTNIQVNSIACKYSSLSIGGQTYSAIRRNTCIALATWDTKLFGDMPCDGSVSGSNYARPVLVSHFVKFSYCVDTGEEPNMHTRVFARVSWFCHHPSKHYLGQPAEIWCNNTFEVFGVHSYIPMSSISTHCIHCNMKVNDENVLVIVPLVL